MEAQQSAAANGDIPPDLRARILDKPRIAEETERRQIGLREAGSPHLQHGEGLLLPEAGDGASAQASQEELRELQLARIERRAPRVPAAWANPVEPTDPGVATVVGEISPAAVASPDDALSRQGPWAPIALALCAVGSCGALVWTWRSSRR